MALTDWCRHEDVGDVAIVTFLKQEILTEAAVADVSKYLKGIVNSESRVKFIIDFTTVTYLTSAALGVLIGVQKRIAAKRGQLKLVGLAGDVREVFRITRLDQVFDIYRGCEAALDAYSRNE